MQPRAEGVRGGGREGYAQRLALGGTMALCSACSSRLARCLGLCRECREAGAAPAASVPVCPHCKERKGRRGNRGLCEVCYDDRDVRAQYPDARKQNGRECELTEAELEALIAEQMQCLPDWWERDAAMMRQRSPLGELAAAIKRGKLYEGE